PGSTPAPPTDATYSDLVLREHPIAFWGLGAADGSSSFYDQVGGHTGYWRNGPPSFSNGIDGDAADFGNPLYGEVNGVTAPTSAYTLEAWVWPNTANDMTFVEHGGAGALGILDGHVVFRQVSTDVTASDAVE